MDEPGRDKGNLDRSDVSPINEGDIKVFESFKSLKSGDIGKVDTKFIYPLLRWSSASLVDLEWCSEVNKRLFFVPPEMACKMLMAGIRDKNAFMKYPKGSKEKTDKIMELKKALIMRYYGWSLQEFDRNSKMVEYIDWSEVADALGLENKERKLLKLSEINTKIKKKEKKSIKGQGSLFSF